MSMPISTSKDPKFDIKYVENKRINKEAVDRYLDICVDANHWTNFGPLSQLLEERLSHLLGLQDDLKVVVCCNATTALHALVMMQRSLHSHSLRWATSSFGFYSSADGVLARADFIDCDEEGMLDKSLLEPQNFDGIIATNIFGQKSTMEDYQFFAEKHQKILIIDSAMGFQAGGHIANECISLHHTKPWGFGECGCAIVHKDHETLLRSIISFGHNNRDEPINRYAMNGKISDIACAYVLMWLDQFDALKESYNEQFQRIAGIAKKEGFSILGGNDSHPGVPANVPLLLQEETKKIPQSSIPVGRYYHPLTDTPRARSIYNRIVNVPCHRDMEKLSDSDISTALKQIISPK